MLCLESEVSHKPVFSSVPHMCYHHFHSTRNTYRTFTDPAQHTQRESTKRGLSLPHPPAEASRDHPRQPPHFNTVSWVVFPMFSSGYHQVTQILFSIHLSSSFSRSEQCFWTFSRSQGQPEAELSLIELLALLNRLEESTSIASYLPTTLQ